MIFDDGNYSSYFDSPVLLNNRIAVDFFFGPYALPRCLWLLDESAERHNHHYIDYWLCHLAEVSKV